MRLGDTPLADRDLLIRRYPNRPRDSSHWFISSTTGWSNVQPSTERGVVVRCSGSHGGSHQEFAGPADLGFGDLGAWAVGLNGFASHPVGRAFAAEHLHQDSPARLTGQME